MKLRVALKVGIRIEAKHRSSTRTRAVRRLQKSINRYDRIIRRNLSENHIRVVTSHCCDAVITPAGLCQACGYSARARNAR